MGARGIRLSGGHRQRIGIARALYIDAEVLILDEATSALDNATEQAVMEAIEGLCRNLTIIVVAHRLTTVACCDRILELEPNWFKASESYSQLSLHFARVAAVKGMEVQDQANNDKSDERGQEYKLRGMGSASGLAVRAYWQCCDNPFSDLKNERQTTY